MGENAEIFQRLAAIEQTLARIDERTKAQADHEKRLRTLEQENARRKGIMAALSLFSSVVGGVLVWLFKTLFGGGN